MNTIITEARVVIFDTDQSHKRGSLMEVAAANIVIVGDRVIKNRFA